jgi:hypothetical protein
VTPADDPEQLRTVIDDLANALQTAIVLAAKLATSLRAEAHDGDVLYDAITRATAALRRLSPTNGDAQ